MLREVAAGLAALAIAAAVGIPVGALWSVLAPRVEVEMTPRGPDLTDYQTEAFMGAEGVFALLGFVAGVLLAVCVWLVLRRRRGPVVLVGLMVGSLLGAWIAWQLGRQVGLAAYRELFDSADVGWRFYRPPGLRGAGRDPGTGQWQLGVLGAQAFTAAIAYTLLAGWSRWPSLRGPDRPVGHPVGLVPPPHVQPGHGPAAYQAPPVGGPPPNIPHPPSGANDQAAPQGSGWPAPPGAPARN